MALRILGWFLAIGAVAAPIVYFTTYEAPLEVTVLPLERGHVEETVAAISSGTVMAAADAMVASGWMGIVIETAAEEGARVRKGDRLVVLDHRQLDAQVRLAEANHLAGESQLKQVKIAAEIYADVARTRVSLANEKLKAAQQNYERIERLSGQEAASQSNLDNFALLLHIAEEDLAAARASQRENLVRKEEISTAESNLEQLFAAVAVAEAARDKAIVLAPFDGVVADIFVEVGEAVNVGMPLLQLVRAESVYVEAPFDEANASQIQVGQKARVNLDAYRDTDFIGKVIYIAPVVRTNADLSRTLNVKIQIEEGAEKFMAGMSADVTIVVEEKDDVLFARSESIIRNEFAYIVEDGRALRRNVETGIGNWNTREIVSGLSEGDLLITSVSLSDLGEGSRVRIVDELGD